VAFVVFSVVNLRDQAAWRSAAWDQEQALLAAGVPATHISGMSEANYWYWWEPAVAQAKAAGQPLSFATHQSLLVPDYVISFTPTPTWVVDTPGDRPPDPYRVCRAQPYAAFPGGPGGTVYTLSRGLCPP